MRKITSAILIAAASTAANGAASEKQSALEKLLEGKEMPENRWLDEARELAKTDKRMMIWASYECFKARNNLEKNTPTKEALNEIYMHCWLTE